MRKIIILVLIVGFLVTSFCEASTKRPSALAIEWWLRGQDKFEGAKINTQELPNGKYEITNWETNGVSQPTDAELEVIINNYEQYLKDKDKFQKESRARVKTKLKELGISQEDLDEVIRN